jgi:putative spermidine/putrescine transport system substrate-binding protein
MKRSTILLITTLVIIITVVPVVAKQQFSGKVLRVGTWGGQWKATTQEFKGKVLEELTGCRVEYVVGNPKNNMAKIIAARESGAPPPIDVIETSEDGTQIRMRKAGLLEKLDYSLLPHSVGVRDRHKRKDAVGFFVVNPGIVYNTKMYKKLGIPRPEKYEDLFRPELAGRVAFPNINVGLWPWMMVGLALPKGGSERNLDSAFKIMEKEKDKVSFYTASAEARTRVASGDLLAMVLTNGMTFRLVNAGHPVAHVDPKAGPYIGFEYRDWAAIINGTRVPKLAHMFINMALDPKVQYEHAKVVGYGPTNKLIEDTFLKDPVLKDRYLWKEEDLAKLYRIDWNQAVQKLPQWTDRWNRLMVK